MPEPYTGQPRSGFLTADRLYLRLPEPDDYSTLVRSANDPEIRGLTARNRPVSRASFLSALETNEHDPSLLWFTIVLKDRDRVIGECGLSRITPAWRRADFELIIGDRASWGKGLGTEAARLVLDHAFGMLSLHRIGAQVVGHNTRAVRFMESLGFQREGIMRDGYFADGRYHDFITMSLLEQDLRPVRKTGRI